MVIEDWSADFLRSQKFNTQIRDWQRYLFKRNRNIVINNTLGAISTTTSWSIMSSVLNITLETTGRPVLLKLTCSIVYSFGAAGQHPTFFDVLCSNGIWASSLTATQLANGAYRNQGYRAASVKGVQAPFLFPTLDAGVYTFTPYWYTPTTGNTVTATNQPIIITAEEI